MELEIELDEMLYTRVLKFLKHRKKNNAEVLNKKVELNAVKSKLTLIARAITATAIELFPADREGGYKDDNFFLPVEVYLFPTKEQNERFYLFRTLYLCVQKQLKLNWTLENFDENLSSAKALDHADFVLQQLFLDFPMMEFWHDEFLTELPFHKKSKSKDLSWLYGKWMQNTGLTTEKSKELSTDFSKLKNPLEADTTIHARAVEEIKSLMVDKKQQEDYVMLHNFEKIEMADEFNGNWRDFDGKDELEDHHEALEEMKMRHTVRVDDPTHSVYQADFVENTSVAESADVNSHGHFIEYDEWDFKKRSYKPNFCKVFPKLEAEKRVDYYNQTLSKYRATLNNLRKMLTSVNNRLQQQKRQLQGDAFDLDAITDLYADLHSGKTPDERIYLSNRKKEKDLSILLLLDLSLSSDGYAAGNRVIDVEKEVSILFGEILSEFNIDFAIDGFSSKTRNHTSYLTLKNFGESWDVAKHKIGAAEPNGYTRIGPALRHAGARLMSTEAKNKWIILLSDGKPNDYDKYEGQYGIQDIKQALRELNEQHINSYALAIEAQAKYYLPQMFGHHHYEILTSPQQLISSLVKLYEKIKHQ